MWFPHVLIYVFFCLISVCILHRKNKNLVLKYMVFVNFWKVQKQIFLKKEKCFLCIQPSISKLKNHIVFSIHQKRVIFLACILALISSLLKSWERWLKFQKQQNFLFYLSFSIRGTTLHVRRISDISFFLWTLEQLGFYP